MFTIKEISEIIKNGENASVEFKSSSVRNESVAKEIVAMANTQGGVILFGIADNGEIEGAGKKGGKNINEEWVMNIARCNIVPAISVEYSDIQIENKRIVLIKVPKGNDKPYQTNKSQYLVRIGSTNRQATQAELMRLFQQAGFYHFDGNNIDGTSINSLNLSKIDKYFNRYEIDFMNEPEDDKINILKNADILDESGKATIGGLLIFGVNPQRFLYNASISFAHFKGIEINDELIDKQNIEDTIDYQVDTTLAVIKNNLLNPSVINGSKREEKNKNYSDKVFRELLVNACVHRNYAIAGSKIRVFLFDDRIEFISPGRLPNTITVEKLKIGVSYAVNPILIKFMENLRYVDKLGRGLPMVYKEAQKLGKEVIFKEIGEEFRVILYL